MARKHPFRDTYLSKHHLLSKHRNGCNRPENICYLWRDKHDAWHVLYRHKTVQEILNLTHLEIRGRKTPLRKWHQPWAWETLWGNKSKEQVVKILKRFSRLQLRKKYKEELEHFKWLQKKKRK